MTSLGAGVAVLIVIAAAILAGPPFVRQWSGRTQLATLQEGSLVRTYRVYRPAGVGSHPGLVIDLHSAHTNGFLEELATRFDAQADRHSWIVAYPDAIAEGWEPYGCCHHDGVDDVTFIRDLIDQLEASDQVDPQRVYVTGLSRGGMMAYRIGCELSSRVAAITPVAGNMADATGSVDAVPCQPDRPVSVLSINGSADAEVPIVGGGRYAPLVDVIGRWRSIDDCQPAGAPSARGAVSTTTWPCAGGTEVRSIVLAGAGHTWPGIPLSTVPWGAAASLDASSTIAEFFAAHQRAPAASKGAR